MPCTLENQQRAGVGSRDRSLRFLPVLFFLSGGSSLVFETVFTRLLTYTFGNTAYAVSTVLASFLGGLALGAVLVGKWADRRPPSLWIYGSLELLVGSVCLFVPSFFSLLTRTYVTLYQQLDLGPIGLTLIRIALGAALILVPTFLMGGTLPVIARYLAARRSNFQPELDRFYALNTWGGAAGVLVSTYILIPVLGIKGTVWIASATSVSVFVVVALTSSGKPSVPEHRYGSLIPEDEKGEIASSSGRLKLLLFGSFLAGVVALAYEIVWTHALSFLIGNTVYAFGLMLFTFLCGLGLGARLVARCLERRELWEPSLVASQVLLGLVVVGTLPLWPRIPSLFSHGISGAYNRGLLAVLGILIGRITYVFWRNRRAACTRVLPWYRANEPHIEALVFALLVAGVMPFLWKYDAVWFMAGEFLRFLCVFGLLIGPSIVLGLTFPLVLNLYSSTSREIGRTVGNIYALNTVGTVLGSLVTGFVLLPRLGSFMTLRGCAALNMLLALVFALGLLRTSRFQKWTLSVASLLVVVLFLGVHGNWDVRRVTGSYAYFTEGWPGTEIVFAKEDIQGGLTSVAKAGPLHILLSNGKFQGDNVGELGTQTRFALIPALFTQKFDRALVIGLGTGNSLRTVARFPFRHIDVVELAPQIVEAARQWFEDVNGRVFDRDPRVAVSIGDGRNFLLLSRERYDMITIEVTSLWISGEADLYNKEFYELCRAHLFEHGVLQQWVALHHLRTRDLLVVMNTAAQVFPHVAFFQGADPGHGLLIASSSPLELDYPRIARFDKNSELRSELSALGIPSVWSLLGELMLYDSSFQKAVSTLPSLTGLRKDFASTDFEPYLEYQAPKGVAVPYDTVEPNTRFLRRYQAPGLPSELPIRNLPSDSERRLILGYVAQRRGNVEEALACFGQVDGPARTRAQLEISQLSPILPTATSTQISAGLRTDCR